MMQAASKLSELVLYVGAKCGLDEHYGVLKLNKILFYSDFLAFRAFGEAITGTEYRKYPHGPAPAAMKELRTKLHLSGEAFEYMNPLPAFNAEGDEMCEKRLLPRRAPNMSLFTSDEIALVDQVIEQLRPMTGTQVSKRSHQHPGWKLAELGEAIPYCAALLPEEDVLPLRKQDVDWAAQVARKFADGGYQANSNVS